MDPRAAAGRVKLGLSLSLASQAARRTGSLGEGFNVAYGLSESQGRLARTSGAAGRSLTTGANRAEHRFADARKPLSECLSLQGLESRPAG